MSFLLMHLKHPKGTTTLPKNQQKNPHLFLCLAVNQHHLRGVLFWEKCFGVFCRRKKQGKTWAGWLVVSAHLKNISQIGSFPQVGLKIKKYLKPQPRWSSLHSCWRSKNKNFPIISRFIQISYLNISSWIINKYLASAPTPQPIATLLFGVNSHQCLSPTTSHAVNGHPRSKVPFKKSVKLHIDLVELT